MGNNEGDKPIKIEKPTSPPPEPNNIHVFPDWAAVQAYYGPGAIPPPYFNPAVASGHAAHPYMWAPPQMMPPYGSPYAAMYSHAGIYGPSATTVVATPLSLETPARSGNDLGSGKTPKKSDARAASGTGNSNSNSNSNCNTGSRGDGGVHGQSQSTECGTAGSCDRSDDSTSREDDNKASDNGTRDSDAGHRQMNPYPSIDANARNGIVQGIPLASSKPLGSNPTPIPQMNHSSSPKAGANGVNIAAPCAPRLLAIGIQDERELKREKRKQSNRESARRSRLRKQAEMEELGKKVDSLTVENVALRSEINKLVEDSEKMRSENAALMEKLKNN